MKKGETGQKYGTLLVHTAPISSQKMPIKEFLDTCKKVIPGIATRDAMIAVCVGLHLELIVILHQRFG